MVKCRVLRVGGPATRRRAERRSPIVGPMLSQSRTGRKQERIILWWLRLRPSRRPRRRHWPRERSFEQLDAYPDEARRC